MTRFEWDKEKSRRNIAKHGVTFETASEAFADPRSVEGDAGIDPATGEQRWHIFGATPAGVLVVVYVERGPRIRINSARKAEKHEKDAYRRGWQG